MANAPALNRGTSYRSGGHGRSSLLLAAVDAMGIGSGPSRGAELKAAQRSQKDLCELLIKCGKGSLLRGWRRELDRDGNLEVEFMDYVQQAARLNFMGDAQLLFGLDADHNTLSVNELSPPEGKLMDLFKQWVKTEFERPELMFVAFDKAGAGRISQAQFMACCREYGWQGNDGETRMVYECCDYGDCGTIASDDVIFLECDRHERSRMLFKAKALHKKEWQQAAAMEYLAHARSHGAENALPPSHRLAPRPWLARKFEQMPAVAVHVRNERQKDIHCRLTKVKDAFLAYLRKIHGHEVRAFRRGLDPDGSFWFGQTKLRSYCRSLNLKLNLQDLWMSLDNDGDGFVRFEEICTPHAVALAQLKTWARKKPMLGSVVAVWDSPEMAAVARRRMGTFNSVKRLGLDCFEEALQELGWPGIKHGPTKRYALKSLDLHSCGQITRADLDWLDSWHPLEWICAEPDPQAWEELRSMLIESYGHPLRAWRCLLDTDDSNKLSWTEFKNACIKLKFPPQKAPGAWRALDLDLSSTVTMREYDPASCDILKSFKDWAEAFFGSIKLCFKAIDKDRSGSVSFVELKRACHRLNWDGDVRLLFDCLDVDMSRAGPEGERSLTLHEVEFLDEWQFDPTEEEIRAQIAATEASDKAPVVEMKRRNSKQRRVAQLRLTDPLAPIHDRSRCHSPECTRSPSLESSASGPRRSTSSSALFQRPKDKDWKRLFDTRPRSQCSLRYIMDCPSAPALHPPHTAPSRPASQPRPASHQLAVN